MTRLKEEDIKAIGHNLSAYDAHLTKMTGLTLKQIAMRATGLDEKEMSDALASTIVGVIPISSGQGIIKSFTEGVREILNYLGAKTFQSEMFDIGGLSEAVDRGASIIFCADDQKFIALNLSLKKVVDNAEATARGYVEALEAAAKSLEGKEVLVIGGAGKVGWNAAIGLKKKGAYVSIYDIDLGRLSSLNTNYVVRVEKDLEKALEKYRILFDASPVKDLIGAEHIKSETIIAAPGIPLGLTEEAYALVRDRLIHDPLQIGVATMLAEALMNSRNDLN